MCCCDFQRRGINGARTASPKLISAFKDSSAQTGAENQTTDLGFFEVHYAKIRPNSRIF
jgi:hypothetical protein